METELDNNGTHILVIVVAAQLIKLSFTNVSDSCEACGKCQAVSQALRPTWRGDTKLAILSGMTAEHACCEKGKGGAPMLN